MIATYDALREARTALDTPLFAGLPGDIRVSFEFFPPKTEADGAAVGRGETLAPLAPEFVSVTYGAGGSTRDRTHDTVARIIREAACPPPRT
jgi:methylenetetrahydrofolate reductase (NADPH)